jgi:TonB-dependent SusC/RagA subfamily outer membrane receptor
MKAFNKILFFVLLVCSFGNAQTVLTGKVLNYKKKPVADASIYLDTIDSNIVTNKDGEFSVTVPEKVKTIKVHSKKYGWLSSSYNNETKMDFVYLELDKSKNEKGASNPQSLSVDKDKNTSTYRTIFDMIRGKLAGVVVTQDNKITIRGVSSFYYSSEPLFVVDGVVVNSIDEIAPVNVKSLSVLKGADASIYGARGSSGVIVIKMKH